MYIIIISLLSVLLLISIIALYRVSKLSNKKIDLYEDWIFDFAQTVQTVEEELDILDHNGTYRSQDEIGQFYQALYSILKRLYEYGIINELPTEEVPRSWRESQKVKIIKRTRRNDIEIEDIQKGFNRNKQRENIIKEPKTVSKSNKT